MCLSLCVCLCTNVWLYSCLWVMVFKCFCKRPPSNEGSHLSKLHFPCNKGERWTLSLESVTSIKKTYKPAKGSLSSSQLFVTSLHYWEIYPPIMATYKHYLIMPSKWGMVDIDWILQHVMLMLVLKVILTKILHGENSEAYEDNPSIINSNVIRAKQF